MSNNGKKDPTHIRIYRIISYVLVIGGFLLLASPLPNQKDTFESLISRWLVAGFVAFLGWLRLKKATDEAANAWDSMPSLFNRTKTTYHCPQCGLPRPQRRFPKSVHQFLWGGWTCEQCGCEVDSIGRKITSD